MNNNFLYLNFINFTDVSLWDFKRYAAKKVASNYPIVKLGDYIQEENTKVKPFDFPDKDFPILGVNNKTGLFDAYIEKGSNINQPYKVVKDGFLAYNPYRVNVGSIGLKTAEQKYNYISPAYVVFSCRQGLLPEFLYILFRTAKFNALIRESTTGSVRQTLSFSSMGNIEIPLPSIEKQKEIVEKYNEEVLCSNNLKNKIINLETEIEKLWVNLLELTFYESQAEHKKTNFLNFVCLSQLSRWDWYNNRGMVNSAKYKFAKLQDVVIGKPLYGAGEKGIKIKSDTRYIRITDINEDGTLNDDFVSVQKVDEKYILRENDFLIARSGNTVGKTFLYKREHGKCIYAGYLIKFKLNLEKVIPEYLLYYTKSKAYKTWISSNQRANAQPNINSEEFLNSPVIIPELSEQKNIIGQIGEIKREIQHLKDKDKNIIHVAHQQFEKELFE